ncbi:hypothetical protein [Cupriavidus sp. AU9028]|uniref:hypothetical protein n=1 Tax=Cupriavidus sp. AU9028 TaxID=2871157 RepID=UPI001C9689DE|nr:hypothetical protein [Cupriavidus sp. AU9028]MBY4896744.1 hypothetical protein [Cupriavidus sp. AU9028]
MLSRKMDKEAHELADSANDTVDELRRAGRHTAGSAREAAMPVLDEVRSLLSQLQTTVSTLSRDGSSEAAHASRRLQERARMLKDRARDMTMEGAVRARTRVNHAVEDVEHRVVESPMKAVMIAAAVGALAAMLLIGGTATAVRRNGQE